jgi:hypothetical protein
MLFLFLESTSLTIETISLAGDFMIVLKILRKK